MSTNKTLTPAEFGYKHKLSRSTVWRYMNVKRYSKYLKMYDAEVVEKDGKRFIKTIKDHNENKNHERRDERVAKSSI